MSKLDIFREHIEYATTDIKEVEFLKKNNIKYSFAKVIDEATIFKYKKTKKLFETLSRFNKFQ